MKYRLSLKVSGPDLHTQKSFELSRGHELSIGRHNSCVLQIKDEKLSRRHCQIEIKENQLMLIDLKSTNGVLIDGEKKESFHLKENSIFKLGSHQIEIVELLKIAPEPIKKQIPKSAVLAKPKPILKNVETDTPKASTDDNDLHNLDDLNFERNDILNLYKLPIDDIQNFYKKIDFSGSTQRSLVIIAICGAISSLTTVLSLRHYIGSGLNVPLNTILSSVLMIPIMALVSSLLIAAILHALRNFLKISGEFSHYLRFLAYAAIFSLPFQLLASLISLPFISSLVGIYFLWLFYQVFHPHFKRGLMVLGILFIISFVPIMLAGGALIGASAFSPFQQQFHSREIDSRQRDRGTNKLTEGIVGNILGQNNEIAKISNLLKVADFKIGEKYTYNLSHKSEEKNNNGTINVFIDEHQTKSYVTIDLSGFINGVAFSFSTEGSKEASMTAMFESLTPLLQNKIPSEEAILASLAFSMLTNQRHLGATLSMANTMGSVVSMFNSESKQDFDEIIEKAKEFPKPKQKRIAGIKGNFFSSEEDKSFGDQLKGIMFSDEIGLPAYIYTETNNKAIFILELQNYEAP